MVFLHIWLKHPLLYSKDERLPSCFLASYFNTLFANVTNNQLYLPLLLQGFISTHLPTCTPDFPQHYFTSWIKMIG